MLRRKSRVVVAENEPRWRNWAREALENAGYVVDTADSVDTARVLLDAKAQPIDVAVFDLHLDKEDERGDHAGLNLALQYPSLRRILWTGEAHDSQMVVEAHRDQIVVSLKGKSGTVDELVRAVREMLARRVFLAHGHDQLKDVVRWYLASIGLEVIVLADEPGGSRTIMELLERSTVEYAVVLLTPDDEGHRRPRPDEPTESLRHRARQNVIFELGFFAATLGRENVFALYSDDVEIPSDLGGIRFITFRSAQEWQQKLRDEFKAVGVPLQVTQR